ncbi:uncharacterized protein VTP21DRAFT_7102 [Calcarisporiella thermophila]|uniref:uncharacterized protein n=1 Tax=Calcarisporiella thermophila TaxID=911321 RepID=UPI003743BADE
MSGEESHESRVLESPALSMESLIALHSNPWESYQQNLDFEMIMDHETLRVPSIVTGRRAVTPDGQNVEFVPYMPEQQPVGVGMVGENMASDYFTLGAFQMQWGSVKSGVHNSPPFLFQSDSLERHSAEVEISQSKDQLSEPSTSLSRAGTDPPQGHDTASKRNKKPRLNSTVNSRLSSSPVNSGLSSTMPSDKFLNRALTVQDVFSSPNFSSNLPAEGARMDALSSQPNPSPKSTQFTFSMVNSADKSALISTHPPYSSKSANPQPFTSPADSATFPSPSPGGLFPAGHPPISPASIPLQSLSLMSPVSLPKDAASPSNPLRLISPSLKPNAQANPSTEIPPKNVSARRSAHKVNEKKRRDAFRQILEDLRELVPDIEPEEKAKGNFVVSKVMLLRKAYEHICHLRKLSETKNEKIKQLEKRLEELQHKAVQSLG